MLINHSNFGFKAVDPSDTNGQNLINHTVIIKHIPNLLVFGICKNSQNFVYRNTVPKQHVIKGRVNIRLLSLRNIRFLSLRNIHFQFCCTLYFKLQFICAKATSVQCRVF